MAALINVATGMLTQKWTLAWIAFVVAIVVPAAVMQAWLVVADHRGADETPSQIVEDASVGQSMRQEMADAGTQKATDVRVDGDLSQIQQTRRRRFR
ncbi:hypothetical protein [Actinomadura gamaensis]|uniref:Uncharacterized protein n=1 Tax=Actinomadura gamaensis TaxID=1763541 RepID=A0ABV9U7V2_9ACTN